MWKIHWSLISLTSIGQTFFFSVNSRMVFIVKKPTSKWKEILIVLILLITYIFHHTNLFPKLSSDFLVFLSVVLLLLSNLQPVWVFAGLSPLLCSILLSLSSVGWSHHLFAVKLKLVKLKLWLKIELYSICFQLFVDLIHYIYLLFLLGLFLYLMKI